MSNSNRLTVRRPHDQTPIKELSMDSSAAVMNALDRAHRLFGDSSRWLEPHQRIAILDNTAALMQEQVETLTRIALEEGGKPCQDSRAEVLRAIEGVKIAAREVDGR